MFKQVILDIAVISDENIVQTGCVTSYFISILYIYLIFKSSSGWTHIFGMFMTNFSNPQPDSHFSTVSLTTREE